MALRVVLTGVTGWAGRELALGIAAAPDLELVGGTSRTHAGATVGKALGSPGVAGLDAPVAATVGEALAARPDVVVEFTHPSVARANIEAGLDAGAHVVVGTSGLTDGDYAALDARARAAGRGVLACGNFALTAVLLQVLAERAARLLPSWEVVEYATDRKPDAPSGTARELVARLAAVRTPTWAVPPGASVGEPGARGASVNGSQVHSVRLPGYVLGVDVLFGLPDETLTIRHNAGESARPYVGGALLAIRRVGGLVGVVRGLDSVLDL
jgi:4-hydroxy-tetrahydrodipicolinate reductase